MAASFILRATVSTCTPEHICNALPPPSFLLPPPSFPQHPHVIPAIHPRHSRIRPVIPA